MSEKFMTFEEQEKILTVAENLIREPDNWVEGHWKCPIGKNGLPISQTEVANGEQKLDKNDRPQFAYCVEGALNEATLAVLGQERALELGAITLNGNGEVVNNGEGKQAVGHDPARLLGINELAQELYGADSALGYNDGDWGDGEHEERQGHAGVLNLIRTQLGRVRDQIGPKSGLDSGNLHRVSTRVRR